MDSVTRAEFFAKPEVQEVLGQLKEAARRALPGSSFTEREAAMLALFDEAGRSLLEEDLQAMADGFGNRLLVGGAEYKRHERGTVQYYSLGGRAAERSRQLTDWNERLDAQDSAIDAIERQLEDQYSKLPSAKREQLWEHLVYIANNKDRMRYVSLSSSCLPIGSGVTESAAKTIVGRRAKNSGQRWSEAGLRGVLTLRALQQSDRLPRFWKYQSRRYVADVAEAA